MHEFRVIDANVILRFLLNDHEEHSAKAKDILASYTVTVRSEVVCEVVYVLQKVYNVPRVNIAKTLTGFLQMQMVQSADEDLLEFALNLYGQKNLDFVDCILIAVNQVRGFKVASFDEKLMKQLSD